MDKLIPFIIICMYVCVYIQSIYNHDDATFFAYIKLAHISMYAYILMYVYINTLYVKK